MKHCFLYYTSDEVYKKKNGIFYEILNLSIPLVYSRPTLIEDYFFRLAFQNREAAFKRGIIVQYSLLPHD